MDLRTYLGALRKSWWLIVAIAALCLAAAFVAFLVTPKTYSSKVTFYVSTPIADGSNPMSSGQFAVTRVNSYVELLSSEKLAREAAAAAGVELSAADLIDKIEGSAELNTVLVTATITDAQPDRALALAQAVSETFPEMVDELDNQGKSGSAVVVLTTVSGPTAPLVIAPSARIYLPIGLVGGLALGVVAALLRELMNTSIRSSDSLSTVLGAAALGTIHYDPATRRSPLIIGDQAASARSESYRHLRTSLQFVDAADAAKVLLITSAVPDEGKTTTSVNLALSFAEFGDRVLLICGDLRRPKLGALLNLSEQNGLTGVLVGQIDIAQAIQQWGNRTLFYLGAGSLPPNPSELLGGERMAALINDLRPKFDKIIIDAPPLLPVTDAAVASAVADGVVVVVRNGSTTRAQLTTARQTLEGVNARIIGGVLNMRKASRGEQRQYGGNSYQLATFEARRRSALERLTGPEPDRNPRSATSGQLGSARSGETPPSAPGPAGQPIAQQPAPGEPAPVQPVVGQASQRPGPIPQGPNPYLSSQPTPNHQAPTQPAQHQPADDQPTQIQPAQNQPAPNQPGQNQPAQSQSVPWESMPPDSVPPEAQSAADAAAEPVNRGSSRRPSR